MLNNTSNYAVENVSLGNCSTLTFFTNDFFITHCQKYKYFITNIYIPLFNIFINYNCIDTQEFTWNLPYISYVISTNLHNHNYTNIYFELLLHNDSLLNKVYKLQIANNSIIFLIQINNGVEVIANLSSHIYNNLFNRLMNNNLKLSFYPYYTNLYNNLFNHIQMMFANYTVLFSHILPNTNLSAQTFATLNNSSSINTVVEQIENTTNKNIAPKYTYKMRDATKPKSKLSLDKSAEKPFSYYDYYYQKSIDNNYNYSYSPSTKIYYPEPFIASPTFVHEDLWFLHIIVYHYWLWFFFVMIIIFFFLTASVTARWCAMRNKPRRETRGLSRSKCGDLITGLLPAAWAVTIVVHESIDSADWDDGAGTIEMTMAIRAYQWGWEYWYPRSMYLYPYERKYEPTLFGHNTFNYNYESQIRKKYINEYMAVQSDNILLTTNKLLNIFNEDYAIQKLKFAVSDNNTRKLKYHNYTRPRHKIFLEGDSLSPINSNNSVEFNYIINMYNKPYINTAMTDQSPFNFYSTINIFKKQIDFIDYKSVRKMKHATNNLPLNNNSKKQSFFFKNIQLIFNKYALDNFFNNNNFKYVKSKFSINALSGNIYIVDKAIRRDALLYPKIRVKSPKSPGLKYQQAESLMPFIKKIDSKFDKSGILYTALKRIPYIKNKNNSALDCIRLYKNLLKSKYNISDIYNINTKFHPSNMYKYLLKDTYININLLTYKNIFQLPSYLQFGDDFDDTDPYLYLIDYYWDMLDHDYTNEYNFIDIIENPFLLYNSMRFYSLTSDIIYNNFYYTKNSQIDQKYSFKWNSNYSTLNNYLNSYNLYSHINDYNEELFNVCNSKMSKFTDININKFVSDVDLYTNLSSLHKEYYNFIKAYYSWYEYTESYLYPRLFSNTTAGINNSRKLLNVKPFLNKINTTFLKHKFINYNLKIYPIKNLMWYKSNNTLFYNFNFNDSKEFALLQNKWRCVLYNYCRIDITKPRKLIITSLGKYAKPTYIVAYNNINKELNHNLNFRNFSTLYTRIFYEKKNITPPSFNNYQLDYIVNYKNNLHIIKPNHGIYMNSYWNDKDLKLLIYQFKLLTPWKNNYKLNFIKESYYCKVKTIKQKTNSINFITNFNKNSNRNLLIAKKYSGGIFNYTHKINDLYLKYNFISASYSNYTNYNQILTSKLIKEISLNQHHILWTNVINDTTYKYLYTNIHNNILLTNWNLKLFYNLYNFKYNIYLYFEYNNYINLNCFNKYMDTYPSCEELQQLWNIKVNIISNININAKKNINANYYNKIYLNLNNINNLCIKQKLYYSDFLLWLKIKHDKLNSFYTRSLIPIISYTAFKNFMDANYFLVKFYYDINTLNIPYVMYNYILLININKWYNFYIPNTTIWPRFMCLSNQVYNLISKAVLALKNKELKIRSNIINYNTILSFSNLRNIYYWNISNWINIKALYNLYIRRTLFCNYVTPQYIFYTITWTPTKYPVVLINSVKFYNAFNKINWSYFTPSYILLININKLCTFYNQYHNILIHVMRLINQIKYLKTKFWFYPQKKKLNIKISLLSLSRVLNSNSLDINNCLTLQNLHNLCINLKLFDDNFSSWLKIKPKKLNYFYMKICTLFTYPNICIIFANTKIFYVKFYYDMNKFNLSYFIPNYILLININKLYMYYSYHTTMLIRFISLANQINYLISKFIFVPNNKELNIKFKNSILSLSNRSFTIYYNNSILIDKKIIQSDKINYKRFFNQYYNIDLNTINKYYNIEYIKCKIIQPSLSRLTIVQPIIYMYWYWLKFIFSLIKFQIERDKYSKYGKFTHSWYDLLCVIWYSGKKVLKYNNISTLIAQKNMFLIDKNYVQYVVSRFSGFGFNFLDLDETIWIDDRIKYQLIIHKNTVKKYLKLAKFIPNITNTKTNKSNINILNLINNIAKRNRQQYINSCNYCNLNNINIYIYKSYKDIKCLKSFILINTNMSIWNFLQDTADIYLEWANVILDFIIFQFKIFWRSGYFPYKWLELYNILTSNEFAPVQIEDFLIFSTHYKIFLYCLSFHNKQAVKCVVNKWISIPYLSKINQIDKTNKIIWVSNKIKYQLTININNFKKYANNIINFKSINISYINLQHINIYNTILKFIIISPNSANISNLVNNLLTSNIKINMNNYNFNKFNIDIINCYIRIFAIERAIAKLESNWSPYILDFLFIFISWVYWSCKIIIDHFKLWLVLGYFPYKWSYLWYIITCGPLKVVDINELFSFDIITPIYLRNKNYIDYTINKLKYTPLLPKVHKANDPINTNNKIKYILTINTDILKQYPHTFMIINTKELDVNNININFSNRSMFYVINNINFDNLIKLCSESSFTIIKVQLFNSNKINLNSINLNSINLNSINLNSINLNSININSININSININSINLNSINLNSINLNSINLNSINLNSINLNSINQNSINRNKTINIFDVIILNYIIVPNNLNFNSINLNTINQNSMNLYYIIILNNRIEITDVQYLKDVNINNINLNNVYLNNVYLKKINSYRIYRRCIKPKTINLYNIYMMTINLNNINLNNINLNNINLNNINLNNINLNNINLNNINLHNINLHNINLKNINLKNINLNNINLNNINLVFYSNNLTNPYIPIKRGFNNLYKSITQNVIAIPVGVRMHLVTTSKDIIHSWAIPSAGIKIDCIPGFCSHRIICFWSAGMFFGQCMEICGRYHHWMPILVYFLHRDLFILWCQHFIFYKQNLNFLKRYDKSLLWKHSTTKYNKDVWLKNYIIS